MKARGPMILTAVLTAGIFLPLAASPGSLPISPERDDLISSNFELIGPVQVEAIEETAVGLSVTQLYFSAWDRNFNLRLRPSPLFVNGAETVWVTAQGWEYADASRTQYLQGEVVGEPGSIVRLTVRQGAMEGLIILRDETYFLEPADRFFQAASEDNTVGYRFSDVGSVWEHYQCGVDHVALPELGLPVLKAYPLKDPFSKIEAAGEAGALLEVELQLLLDSQYSNKYGADSASQAYSLIHQVNGIFEKQFGVTFRIAGARVSLSPSQDPVSAATDPKALLDELAASGSIGGADLAHLLTGRDLEGAIIGLSWTGAVCDRPYGVGLTQDLSNAKMRLAVTAHELGHSLGASHDGSGLCSSVTSGYIMWPVIQSFVSSFSECSEKAVRRRLDRVACVSPLSPEPLPAPAVVNPLDSVSTSESTFLWEETEGAQGYFIEIYDDEADEGVIYSGTVQETQLEPETPLHTGKAYQWRIAAQDSKGLGERTPWQTFTLFENRWKKVRR